MLKIIVFSFSSLPPRSIVFSFLPFLFLPFPSFPLLPPPFLRTTEEPRISKLLRHRLPYEFIRAISNDQHIERTLRLFSRFVYFVPPSLSLSFFIFYLFLFFLFFHFHPYPSASVNENTFKVNLIE